MDSQTSNTLSNIIVMLLLVVMAAFVVGYNKRIESRLDVLEKAPTLPAPRAEACPAELEGLHFSHSIMQRPYRNADMMLSCFYRKPTTQP